MALDLDVNLVGSIGLDIFLEIDHPSSQRQLWATLGANSADSPLVPRGLSMTQAP